VIDFSPELDDNTFFPPNADPDKFSKSFPELTWEKASESIAELQQQNSDNRIVLDKKTPPPDFDPSKALLTMQWPEVTLAGNRESIIDLSNYYVEIFADGYFLGSLEIEDPSFRNCYRSTDGRMVAVHTQNDQIPFSWFSLDTLELQRPFGLISSHLADLAFSHDNRYLAAAGCLPECGLYLVELDTGETKLLRSTGRAGSPNHILWNSEGDQIAYTLADHFARTILVINVVDVETGDLTYAGRLNQTTYEFLPPGSPTITWGAAYPPITRENLGPEVFTPPVKGCMIP
jgi:hypothetical protein